MKKQLLIVLLLFVSAVTFSQNKPLTKEEKKRAKRERLSELMRQEEEGALIFQKQNEFGIKLNTDGYGIFYEHGKYKTITTTNLWWLELGEHHSNKEEKITITDPSGFYAIGNPYIYGKINNFYNAKLGFGQQRLIGGKGNKNGVAVTAIYGGGFSAGLLKPYYLSVVDKDNSLRDIKYSSETDSLFRDPSIIVGSSGFTKGFGEMKFVPSVFARASLRFDYGRYNETLSAIEVGVNAEYYTKEMQIMLDNKGPKFFFNGYVALVFGKRK